MKKMLISLSLFLLLFTGCDKKLDINKMSLDEKVNYAMQHMTLDEKIAQMLIVYYSSYSYDETLSEVIKNVNPGGFILFNDNILNHEQLNNFIRKMKEDSKIPMFISIDQEGGLVQRLKPTNDIKVSLIPAMSTITDEADAFNIGKTIGNDLKKYGINMNFAPVIDINMSDENTVIDSRSFGSVPETVSKLGLAVANGLEEQDIIPVFKHFPGHGSTTADPHFDLPILNKSKEELYQHELIPFIEAIKNGANVIMIGHIAVPQITGDNTPASLSKEVITDLLKNELDFKGLVVTDALNMRALTKYHSQKEIIVNAINSGVDLLLMPGSSSKTISIIKKAIENNEIKEETINNSVKKILELKFSNQENFKTYYEKITKQK